MPTERMEEVEVVCPRHSAEGRGTCIGCQADFTRWLPIKPGSLTAARLRLADAAEAWWMATGAAADYSRDWGELLRCLAALRTKRAGG